MKEFIVKINKRFIDKKIIVLSNLNINNNTKYRKINKLLNEVSELEPTQIMIPGNLYNYNKGDSIDNKVNTFLKELSSIGEVYYVKGENELKRHIDIENQDNLNLLCDYNNSVSYCKSIHINGMNIFGMRLGNSYYQGNKNHKLYDLIYKYASYFDNIYLKENDVNILLCHDALIKHLYDYSNNLKEFDIVITSNNYKEKEQLNQKGTTLFFLADSINKSKIINPLNNFDILNCEYRNTRALVRKR